MTAPGTPSTGGARGARRSPRERLLAAADELFYTEGVHVVGVDRVLHQAGVAKASLYGAFAGKEELVAAYLHARRARILTRLHEAVEQHTDPRRRLLAVFDAQARWVADPRYHGCAFARATAESSTGLLVQQAADDYRSAVLELLTRLATDAGAADPAALGLRLHLLYHGAAASPGPVPRPALATAIRHAARTLLDTCLPSSGPS